MCRRDQGNVLFIYLKSYRVSETSDVSCSSGEPDSFFLSRKKVISRIGMGTVQPVQIFVQLIY
jgi:hypothetical protein